MNQIKDFFKKVFPPDDPLEIGKVIDMISGVRRRFPIPFFLSAVLLGAWTSAWLDMTRRGETANIFAYVFVFSLFAALLKEAGVISRKQEVLATLVGGVFVSLFLQVTIYQVMGSLASFIFAAALLGGGGGALLRSCLWHGMKGLGFFFAFFAVCMLSFILLTTISPSMNVNEGVGAATFGVVAGTWMILLWWLRNFPAMPFDNGAQPSKKHKNIGETFAALGIIIVMWPFLNQLATHKPPPSPPSPVQSASKSFFLSQPPPLPVAPEAPKRPLAAHVIPPYDYSARNSCLLPPVGSALDIDRTVFIQMGKEIWRVESGADGKMLFENAHRQKAVLDLQQALAQLQKNYLETGHSDWDAINHLAAAKGHLGTARFKVLVDDLSGPAPDGPYCYGFTLLVKF